MFIYAKYIFIFIRYYVYYICISIHAYYILYTLHTCSCTYIHTCILHVITNMHITISVLYIFFFIQKEEEKQVQIRGGQPR